MFNLPDRTPTPHTTPKNKTSLSSSPLGLFALPSREATSSLVSPPKPKPQPKRKLLSGTLLDYAPSLKLPKTTSYETKLDRYYHVNLSGIHATPHTARLTVTPKATEYDFEPPEPFNMWKQENSWLCVPRFYGLEEFGVPKIDQTTLGAPMNPEVKFEGKLLESPQFPQISATDAWEAAGGNGFISIFCGGGKTICAVDLAIKKARRTLVLVHKEDLIDQWKERIETFAPKAKVGRLQQNKAEIEGYDFTIGILHSVFRRDYEDMHTFGLVIVDEAHHIGARTFSQTMFKLNPRYTLGLSATPDRKDGLTDILYWLLGPMVFQAKRADVKPQIIRQILYHQGNQKPIKYAGGRPGTASMITRLSQDPKRNLLIMEHIHELKKKPDMQKIIIITDRRDHINWLHTEISKHYTCGKYQGGMKAKDLTATKEMEVIVATYGMAREALDIYGMNGMVLATPSGDVEQVIGRLRERKGEDGTYNNRYIIDIVDPFDIFNGMAWKRFKLYKKFDYDIQRVDHKPESFF